VHENASLKEIRVDKWLWAARFFKTRGMAAQAARGGKIEVNGARVKPGRTVRAGDQLTIRRGPYQWTVVIKDLSSLRGPASQAQTLYQESEESLRRRKAAVAQIKLEQPPKFDLPGRPSKKERRAIARFTKTEW
jgi:ribosome-associated heat shock protein Hsp15